MEAGKDWVSVTDRLCIGPAPQAVVDCGHDVARAVHLIDDGLCVSVADDEAAVAVLTQLGVEPEQAERQVCWSHGQM